jgi:two-component system OmpR family sensor kinase
LRIVFKSLQARLTLSHLIVLIVCLLLVGLATLVLLRGYQRDLTFKRLADRGGLAAQLTVVALRRGASFEDAVENLAQQMNRADAPAIFIYLLDSEGYVIAGSNDRLKGQRFEQLDIRSMLPPAKKTRNERRLITGERLLYVAEPVRVPVGEGPPAATYILILGQVYRPVRLALGDLLPRLMWAGVIALALSIAVAALVAYSVARPLDRIARAAEEIASGNYEQQLDISSPIEVARLATSFNSMARQVQSTLQSQQDLVANVSHELKTPLTSIQGFSQALVDGTAGDEPSRQRAATIIHEEAGRMRRLVDELLDLARLEARQVTLAREPVDVGELVRANVTRFAPQAEQMGVQLEAEISPFLPTVVGDADRLEQVFGNLIDNALKHAQNASGDGRVMLRAEQQDHLVICSVADNGPGIPPEELPRIFERFYQVDKSRARRGSGAGLGLAIVREIVQAHGGRIRAESVEGLGTRFTIELPKQADKILARERG